MDVNVNMEYHIMGQVANVKYFAQRCNQILGTSYSWNSEQVIKLEWVVKVSRRVYNDIHTNINDAYHTHLLSSRIYNDNVGRQAVDVNFVNDIINYLKQFKGVCTCATPSVPTVCGVCESNCASSQCNCNCTGDCECNCNCQCECSASNNSNSFCNCNCTSTSNCITQCECNCCQACDCNCWSGDTWSGSWSSDSCSETISGCSYEG